MRRTRNLLVGLAALVGLGAVSACGGGGQAAGETAELNLALVSASDVVPAYIAVDQGFFREENLDVTINVVASGAAMVPAVLNGQSQIGFANALSVVAAAGKGLPLKIVMPGVVGNPDLATSTTALLVSPTSGITDARSLEGRTIAVASQGNLAQVATTKWMTKTGADPSKVNWVELQYPEMVPAIQRGNIDGASLAEPFVTQGVAAGLVNAGDPIGVELPAAPIGVYFTSASFAEENPQVVAAFRRAMAKAFTYAQNNEAEVRAQLTEVFDLDPHVASTMRLGLLAPELTTTGVDAVTRLAHDGGITDAQVPADSLIIPASGQ